MNPMDLRPEHVGRLVAVSDGTPETGSILVGQLASYELQHVAGQALRAVLFINGQKHALEGNRLAAATVEIVEFP